MTLRLIEIDGTREVVGRTIESPTPGVVLVDCGQNPDSFRGAPFHWRAGNWKKPPLDVQIDQSTGLLLEVQFVLQDETIGACDEGSVDDRPNEANGAPRFDLSHWPAGARYVDVTADVKACWPSTDTLRILIGSQSSQTVVRCRASAELAYLIDADSKLVGFDLLRVTPTEKQVVQKAEPYAGASA